MDIYIDEGKGYLNYPIKMVTDRFFKFLNKDNMMYFLKWKKILFNYLPIIFWS